MAIPDLDLAPNPGAAPMLARWWAQARMEFRSLMTNGEQLLLTLVIPVAALVAVVALGLADVATATPGVLGLTILSSAFTATAIATGFERRSGVLKFLSATPLSRTGLLAGKVGATGAVVAAQWLLVLGTAQILGWDPVGIDPAAAIGFGVLGTAALGTWGFALAGLLRAEATLAVANALFLLLMFAGGTILPVTLGPPLVATAISLLPSAALGTGLRLALDPGGSTGSALQAAVVLVVWLVAGILTAARTFRWE